MYKPYTAFSFVTFVFFVSMVVDHYWFQPLLHSTRSALITGPAMHDRR
jgi:hypothetical protein